VNYWNRIAYSIFLGFAIAACNTVAVTKVSGIPATSISTGIPKTPSIPFPSTATMISPTITEVMLPPVEETSTFQPAILAEVATLDAIVSEKPELKEFYDRFCITHGNCAYVANLGLSPNKEWAVFFSVENGTGGLSIVNVASKKQWDISYYDITGESCCDASVVIEHWSHDGRYLYVSPQMAGSGGLFWFWRDYIQLIQINLENGIWINTDMGSSFSFSPDDRFIAYRRERNVVIHELQTGQERMFTVPAEYGAFGRFVWSLDGTQIIFIGSSVDELQSDVLFDQASGFTLFLLDTENMKAQAIIEKDERYLYPLEWQAPNIVLLERLYQVASDGSLHYDGVEKYKLDLETNNISKYESP
jgi:hypothetical protein